MTEEILAIPKEKECEIIEGDCLEIMRGWPDSYVDGIVTSPPFRDADVQGDYWDFYLPFVKECQRVTRDYSFILNSSRRLIDIIHKTDVARVLVWNKLVTQHPYRYQPIFAYAGQNPTKKLSAAVWNDSIGCLPILRFPQGMENWKRLDLNSADGPSAFQVVPGHHPYEDPVKVYFQLCRYLKKGGSKLILDPCLGSGTTLVACARLGLQAIGIEKEHQYVELARKRVSQYLGQERLSFGD